MSKQEVILCESLETSLGRAITKQPLRSSCIRPDLGRHSRQAVPAHYPG